jgi:hypothetical protein
MKVADFRPPTRGNIYMSAMPGPPSIDDHDYGRDVPLKAVSVRPPAAAAIQHREKYVVHIELSRNGSKWEQDAVKKFFPKGRIYANTLELSDTTVESVAEGAKELSGHLAALEREARKAEDAELELERQREEAAAAEEARHQRISQIASGVKFD